MICLLGWTRSERVTLGDRPRMDPPPDAPVLGPLPTRQTTGASMAERKEGTFKPKVIVFCCNWCAYAGADLAGVSRLKISPHFRIVRTMCSGRVDPELVLQAFLAGADGIMVAGCHPGECHYMEGNYKAMRRVAFMKRLLEGFGVEPDRLALEWVSASEGAKFQEVINGFVERIEKLGPSPVKKGVATEEHSSEQAAR
jgi:F420-non-reducing hydrogenase iron-sulfur subunit